MSGDEIFQQQLLLVVLTQCNLSQPQRQITKQTNHPQKKSLSVKNVKTADEQMQLLTNFKIRALGI